MTQLRRYGILGGSLLLLYGGLGYWQCESMLSPGHLVEGHADLGAACFRCHSPFRGVDTARCVSCHRLPEIGVRTVGGAPLRRPGTPFHQNLREGSCATCHTDHAGPDARGTLAGFEHGLLVASALETCDDCHDSQRPGDMIHSSVKTGCNPCHGTDAWKPATFSHERYFRFDRDHPENCETCHTTPGDLSAYTCYGCHDHTPRNIRSEHLEEGIREFEACEDCHRSADEEEAERAWKKLRGKEERRSSRESRQSDGRHREEDDSDDDSDHEEDG